MQLTESSYFLFNAELIYLFFLFPFSCALSLFPMTDVALARIPWDISFYILTCTRNDPERQLECLCGGRITNFYTTM